MAVRKKSGTKCSMMTLLRLNNKKKKSAFCYLGEPVEALANTAWTCTIYREHFDLVVTLF